jgi:hypothetical protein
LAIVFCGLESRWQCSHISSTYMQSLLIAVVSTSQILSVTWCLALKLAQPDELRDFMTNILISLAGAAAMLGPEISKPLLLREHRAGRLFAWKMGRKLFTSETDIQDWIRLCRDTSSHPVYISAPDVRQVGSSKTANAKSGQASAQNTAMMLRNFGKPLPTTVQAGPSTRRDLGRRSA